MMRPTENMQNAFVAAGGGQAGLAAACALLPDAIIEAVHAALLTRLTSGLSIQVVDGNAHVEWPNPATVKLQAKADAFPNSSDGINLLTAEIDTLKAQLGRAGLRPATEQVETARRI